MNRHVLRCPLKRIGDRAGVKNVHPHRLRHSFATEYLRNGGKVLALQELLGRSDLEMVHRYAKLVEADIALDDAIASPADQPRLWQCCHISSINRFQRLRQDVICAP